MMTGRFRLLIVAACGLLAALACRAAVPPPPAGAAPPPPAPAAAEAGPATIVTVYDVRDLIVTVPDFNAAPELNLPTTHPADGVFVVPAGGGNAADNRED